MQLSPAWAEHGGGQGLERARLESWPVENASRLLSGPYFSSVEISNE